MDETTVLIVGGGTTGLSAAYFLARSGIGVTLVERHPTTAIMPKARAFNGRSMEIYRAYGLEAEIQERESILAGLPEMIGAETLAGAERFRADTLAHVRPGDISPADWAMIDQDELERLLRAHAEAAGADIRFGTELVALDPAADRVTATLHTTGNPVARDGHDGGPVAHEGHDGGLFARQGQDIDPVAYDGAGPAGRDRPGREYRIAADYVIAADGNRAGVRGLLGIGADGPGVLGHAAHFLFDADLDEALRGRRFMLAYFDHPAPGTVLAPLGRHGRWMLGVPFRPGDGDFTPRRCVDAVRSATGIPDLDVTLVPPAPGWGDPAMDVTIGAWVARRYRAGRVFVAGDAAHVFPPTGSFGANTGIADAHNLAWKLAAVLRGHAGPGLLDTYEAERRPVATVTMETALAILRDRHGATGQDATRIDETAMAFGYRYRSAAVCEEAGTPDGAVEDPRTPSGRPGLRVPHVWVAERVSTVDLGCGVFTLLAGPEWAEAAREAAAALRIRLDVHPLLGGSRVNGNGVGGSKVNGNGAGGSGASLIRPDGFVAWRATALPERPADELKRVLTGILAR